MRRRRGASDDHASGHASPRFPCAAGSHPVQLILRPRLRSNEPSPSALQTALPDHHPPPHVHGLAGPRTRPPPLNLPPRPRVALPRLHVSLLRRLAVPRRGFFVVLGDELTRSIEQSHHALRPAGPGFRQRHRSSDSASSQRPAWKAALACSNAPSETSVGESSAQPASIAEPTSANVAANQRTARVPYADRRLTRVIHGISVPLVRPMDRRSRPDLHALTWQASDHRDLSLRPAVVVRRCRRLIPPSDALPVRTPPPVPSSCTPGSAPSLWSSLRPSSAARSRPETT